VQNNWIGLLDAAVQYYMRRDASAMTDDEWADTIAQLGFLRTQEKDASEATGKWNYL
jgi:hypothetical protein